MADPKTWVPGNPGDLQPYRSRRHSCESCEDCLHNGAKCCGCYDGVCCRESGRTPDTRPLYDILKAGRVESTPEQPEGENR